MLLKILAVVFILFAVGALIFIRKNSKSQLHNSEIKFFVGILILCLSIILSVHLLFPKSELESYTFWYGLIIEATGFMLDIILFGIIYTWYRERLEKKKRIENYKNEIEFLRPYREGETTYKIARYIILLNEEGIEKFDLKECFLRKAKLNSSKIKDSELYNSNLKEAILENANLSNSKFGNSDLTGSNLTEANFSNADLTNAKIKGAILKETDFTDARLDGLEVDSLNWIENNKNNIKGIEKIKAYYEVIKKGDDFYLAKRKVQT